MENSFGAEGSAPPLAFWVHGWSWRGGLQNNFNDASLVNREWRRWRDREMCLSVMSDRKLHTTQVLPSAAITFPIRLSFFFLIYQETTPL